MELDAKKIAAGTGLVALLGGASQADRFFVSEDEMRDSCTLKIERLEDRLERHVEVANQNTRLRNSERRRTRELYPAVEDPDFPGDHGGEE